MISFPVGAMFHLQKIETQRKSTQMPSLISPENVKELANLGANA